MISHRDTYVNEQYPVFWLFKREQTVENSTYGSELIAARIAVDMIIAMRYKLRMLGVPIEERSVLVGDNMSVVLNTTLPSSSLKKKHLACNYHRVREAIAGKIIRFGHIDTNENVADICTKPLTGPDFMSKVSKYMFRTSEASKGRKLGPEIVPYEGSDKLFPYGWPSPPGELIANE